MDFSLIMLQFVTDLYPSFLLFISLLVMNYVNFCFQRQRHGNNGAFKVITYLLTYLLTCLLTPWCRILFEKLMVTQLVKKYPAFFMECSQKPATGLYPEPAESSSPHRSQSP
jgi:hypothetical protein